MPLNQVADYWIERRVRAMGCTASIVVGDAPAGVADWAVSELERLEQCWSRFRVTSELSRVNAHAGTSVAVSSTLLRALTAAAALHRATGRRFDPTILDALERAGYDRSFELLPDRGVFADEFEPAAAPGFARIEIDEEASIVCAPSGVTIDLGGIGKGLAADMVARGLIDRGARSALVSIGGDLRACGAAPDGAWRIPVEDPLDESRTAFFHDLVTGALVTSTTRIRAWRRDGRAFHHLIDPATGDSARSGIAAVVATAPDAWWAEGVAKAIVVAGADKGRLLARATEVRAWIFLDDGTVLT